eukprot:Skav215606  [mRNA]  locus=scaffold666:461065:462051:- [translate_table: standard]
MWSPVNVRAWKNFFHAGARQHNVSKALGFLGPSSACVPHAEFSWTSEALESAIQKCRKEKIVALSCQEPCLHSRCVHGLLECNQVELAVDLAAAWNIAMAVDLTQRLQDVVAKREAEFLCLPPCVSVSLVHKEEQVKGLSSLLAASAIGFDVECYAKNGEPTLLQLGSVDKIFLVDLLALGEDCALADTLQEIWKAKMPKVGFGGAEDLCKVARSFPVLGHFAEGSETVDLRHLEVERRLPLTCMDKKTRNITMQGISLSGLADQYLGRPLDKTFQVGDWSRRPMSKARMHYAALDAWVTVKVFEILDLLNAARRQHWLVSGRDQNVS